MADYDFSTLNDKEFEILGADLLSEVHGKRFERFKPGRDGGVDGRFYSPSGREYVLQCKHWPNTPLEKLVARLRSDERTKVVKLNPERYCLAVSNPLSRRDKQSILEALAPYITRADDIYGREDLNDLLSRHPNIERRHYKLWIHSSAVLARVLHRGVYDRSQFAAEEIIESSKRYVRTKNHDKAMSLLDKHQVLIVAGEPGIGKTSLAEQICYDHIAEGFSLVKVAGSILDAENAFEEDQDQIFLFDDFLGRNYLEALSGHESSHIVQFIRRIQKASDKRFVLTSRSTILNRGKALFDTFQHNNLEKNEYLLTIASLTPFEKAKILYNHIWFSGMTDEYVEEIYKARRYRSIIEHRNFNPRLIRFITDRDRLGDCKPNQYWARIESSLTNPADVWEHPFVAQQDDYGRVLVLLVTLNRRPMQEGALATAFSRYVDASPTLSGSFDFVGSLKQLTGSLLSRTIRPGGPTMIDLFNPSIGDFVIRRYSADTAALTTAISCLRSHQALETLRAMRAEKMLTLEIFESVHNGLIHAARASTYQGFDENYLTEITSSYIRLHEGNDKLLSNVVDTVKYLIQGEIPDDCTSSAEVHQWALEHHLLEPGGALKFLNEALEITRIDTELQALSRLFSELPTDLVGYDSLSDRFREAILSAISEELKESIAASDVLVDTSYGDYEAAREKVADHVADLLAEFHGLSFSRYEIDVISDAYDVQDALDTLYHHGSGGGKGHGGQVAYSAPLDDIDDLFER